MKEDDFIFLDPPYDTFFSDYGNEVFTGDFREDDHSECAWNSLSKFFEQFYFSKTIETMQKASANPLLFCSKGTIVPDSDSLVK